MPIPDKSKPGKLKYNDDDGKSDKVEEESLLSEQLFKLDDDDDI